MAVWVRSGLERWSQDDGAKIVHPASSVGYPTCLAGGQIFGTRCDNNVLQLKSARCRHVQHWTLSMLSEGTREVPIAATLLAAPLVLLSLFLAGCERERREFRLDPPAAEALDNVAAMPNGIGGAPPPIYSALDKPYVSNAYDLSQGKRLFAWFGCSNCHGSDGLGGAGPPLLDGWWQYGPDVVSIYLSIRDGRMSGMPAFRDKLNNEQIWQLTGYVQTLGAYVAKTAAPSRDDTLQTRPAENRAPAAILFDQFPQIR
jgi:cytochrome c oxidase cbb3-type subunit III